MVQTTLTAPVVIVCPAPGAVMVGTPSACPALGAVMVRAPTSGVGVRVGDGMGVKVGVSAATPSSGCMPNPSFSTPLTRTAPESKEVVRWNSAACARTHGICASAARLSPSRIAVARGRMGVTA